MLQLWAKSTTEGAIQHPQQMQIHLKAQIGLIMLFYIHLSFRVSE